MYDAVVERINFVRSMVVSLNVNCVHVTAVLMRFHLWCVDIR